MPFSDEAKNLMLNTLAVSADWVTVHMPTTLTSGAAAAQNQVAVADPVEVGATVKVDAAGANEETHSVTATAGTGPYTLTLAANLANTHSAGVYVSYDPNVAVGPKEPSGGAPAFARKAITWNAAALGNLDSAVMPEFDVAANTPMTHAVVMDGQTGGSILGWGEFPLTEYDAQAVFRLRDVDLHLNVGD